MKTWWRSFLNWNHIGIAAVAASFIVGCHGAYNGRSSKSSQQPPRVEELAVLLQESQNPTSGTLRTSAPTSVTIDPEKALVLLYQALLWREPDPASDGWLRAIRDGGISGIDFTARGIARSSEFQSRIFAHVNRDDILKHVYETLVGVQLDETRKQQLLYYMPNGIPDVVAATLIHTTQFQNLAAAAGAQNPNLPSPQPPPIAGQPSYPQPVPVQPAPGVGNGECRPLPPLPLAKLEPVIHNRPRPGKIVLDVTPKTCDREYCAAVMGEPRLCCPLGLEGSPTRTACEGFALGRDPEDGRLGPHWSISGNGSVQKHPDNPNLAYVFGNGTVTACTNVAPIVCGSIQITDN